MSLQYSSRPAFFPELTYVEVVSVIAYEMFSLFCAFSHVLFLTLTISLALNVDNKLEVSDLLIQKY
jgi:hypothetical protein